MKRNMAVLSLALLAMASCGNGSKSGSEGATQTISVDDLRDKIAGGWAGKMIGVAYGAPSEFAAGGRTYEDSLTWESMQAASSRSQDDLYVQLTFMMTMDRYGIDAPAEKFLELFAKAGYPLWHANVMARKNYFDGIMPPASGSPENNLHADDIDFQIEADYIGFMCPGMPQTAAGIADKVGHIMNYGDGVYGGIFVGALYTQAFFERDIPTIVDRALLSIPADSDYAKIIRDVILLHRHYPDDWRAAWRELEAKWGEVDICGALQTFNIDAKLNGAYIVMGLLYGGGDFAKTMEIATRCGQDSDCNPSNAAAVIGVINGYSAIPDYWKAGVAAVADSQFIFTDYSFNTAVENTLKYARELVTKNGGTVTDTSLTINIEEPVAPPLKVSFPNVVPVRRATLGDSAWTWRGDWRDNAGRRASDRPGDEATFTFEGTGIVIEGIWSKTGGIADAYVDGKLNRIFDTYFNYAGDTDFGNFLWHILNLEPGSHTVRIVVRGEKRPESEGTTVTITGATVFTTGPKKNELVKFSFQQ